MNKDFVCGYAFGTLITVIIIASTVVINNRKIPQAIDVYKDKGLKELVLVTFIYKYTIFVIHYEKE